MHSTITTILSALSHPGTPEAEGALDPLGAAAGRRALGGLIDHWGPDPRYAELVAFMQQAREAPGFGLEQCWGAGLEGPGDSAVELCLRLCAAGFVGQWRQPLASPKALRIGRYPLRVAGFIAVTSSPSSLSVQTEGRRYHFRRGDHHRLSLEHDSDPTALPTFCIGEREVVVIDRAGVGPRGTVTGLPPREPLAWEVDSEPWVEAAELLEAHCPAYARWCRRLIRAVILLDAGGRPEMFSASTSQRLGVVESSHHPQAIKLAESLVHEASHQHFFLAAILGAVDDGSDTRLYYSPVVKRARPIDKILFAYHAFANVLLLYRACMSAGVDTGGFCELEHDTLLPTLDHLDSTLRTTRALTPVGHALWAPLARELEATS